MSLLTRERVDGSLAPSATTVVATPPSGPVFSGRRAPDRRTSPATFVPMLGRRDRVTVAILSAAWGAFVVLFWAWWLLPEHRVTWAGLVINSVLLLYLSYLPVSFIGSANRLRRVDPALPVPQLRVAFVVTKAPSEPWPVARQTLEAMLAQHYPYAYDVWLCDEDPAEETENWCTTHGVQVSTRRGVDAYHRAEWPRRTRCKEGNLAYFYDHWGYERYDVVAQLDCDHVPEPSYLTEMVRPFTDPSIGYVAAPSMNDRNAAESWSTRGRGNREAALHGPVQAGHQGDLAPLCFGSHYAVRTSALQTIGGVGPELAEDFSTTFLMNSGGWRGAFAHDAEAHGEGPATLGAMVTQEFQWARSLVTVMADLVPRHLPRLPWRLRLQFLFNLTYYPLLTLITAVGLTLPPIAAVTGITWVDVSYLEFLLRWGLVSATVLTMAWLLRRRGLLRPRHSPLISWEAWLYTLARIPYFGWGVWAAVAQKVRPRPVEFKVTPKGSGGWEELPVRLVVPYVVLSVFLSEAALFGEGATDAAGYVFLCLLGSVTYAVVSFAVVLLHAHEAARSAEVGPMQAVGRTVKGSLSLTVVTLVPLLPALAIYPGYADRVFGW